MVDSQVRPSDIADRRIVRAMLEIPREAFVPLAARALAYKDADLRLPPTAKGQPARALLAPRTLAKLLELASIDPGDAVLDVGCASGYSAAVLSRLAGSVVALESDQRLADEARKAPSEPRDRQRLGRRRRAFGRPCPGRSLRCHCSRGGRSFPAGSARRAAQGRRPHGGGAATRGPAARPGRGLAAFFGHRQRGKRLRRRRPAAGGIRGRAYVRILSIFHTSSAPPERAVALAP